MRKGVYILIVLVISVLFATLFASADSDEEIIKNLICERTDTLSYYYAGLADKKDTMAKISDITTDFLREEDLGNLERYFQCDFEQVVDYKIRDIKVNYSDEDVICAEVVVDWKSNGLRGMENFSNTYSVICKKEENIYKLAQFF